MNREIAGSLAWAGVIIGVALGSTFADQQGYIGGDMSSRIVLGATGLMIAWYGNRLPKTLAPTASARQVNRIAGWSLALSGLVYAGLWAFAPFQVALIGGCSAIIIGMAVTISYCLSQRSKAGAA